MQAAAASSEPGSPNGSSSKKRKREAGNAAATSAKSQRIKQEAGDGNMQPYSSALAASEWTEELEQLLFPTAEEYAQLASVLSMYGATTQEDAEKQELRCCDRLDKHGIATEQLPDEAGVATLLQALSPESEGFPHSLSTLEVRPLSDSCHIC
jgi:hypothetical protein